LRQQAEVREIEEQLLTARSAAATALKAVPSEASSCPCPLGSYNNRSRPGTAGSQQPGTERHFPVQPMSQPLLWSTPSAAPPGDRAVPDEVIVERHRNLGQRTLRLWAEDCANRGGVRVHATDPESLAEVHVDLRDSDVQELFDGYCQTLTANATASGAPKPLAKKDHGEQLVDFMGCLLDAAFLELDPKSHTLQLRVPAAVDPPVRLPPPPVETTDSLLSKEWIREKLLTPRRLSSSRSSRPSSAASRVLRSSVGAAYRQALSVTASRRPQSARRAEAMHSSRCRSKTPQSCSGFSNILSEGNVCPDMGDFSGAHTGSNSSCSVRGAVMEQWLLVQNPPHLCSLKHGKPTVPSGLDVDIKTATPRVAWSATRRHPPCSRPINHNTHGDTHNNATGR